MPLSFVRIVYAAAPAALIAGLLLSAMQLVEIVPLLRKAETFEVGGHGHAPFIGATVLANVAIAASFALFVAAAMTLRGDHGWRRGLLWGLAGYAVFFVSPALGLPPELPGTESAPLASRQAWWVAASASSASGLALMVFARNAALRAVGLVLVALPHLIGAPHPAIAAGTVPAELGREFVRATFVANAAFWLALGVLVGLFFPAAAAA